MVDFKLFGIPVRVEPVFWLTLGLIGFLSTNMQSANAILLLALFVIAGFLSILIHEMGHALMVKHYKQPTQIVLSSFGGYATHPAGVLDRKQSFLVTAAGPGLQVLAALALLFSIPYLNLQGNLFTLFLFRFIEISIFWAILNCLPVIPLDGGRMLESILGPRRRAGLHLTSLITASIIGIYALTEGYIFGMYFMGMFAYQNYQAWQEARK